jgi:hypothetical protein
VLEEVREAALARLDLVARARLDDDVERDEVRVVGRHRHQPEPVRQVVDSILIGKNLALLRLLRKAHEGQ